MDVVVYKITIKDTVEERIVALQEKKRELANAAIEGKGVGKLSMKDILALFRRDAEHLPDHADANVSVAMDKSRVLVGPSSSNAPSRPDEMYGIRRSAPFITPGNQAGDDAYARRW